MQAKKKKKMFFSLSPIDDICRQNLEILSSGALLVTDVWYTVAWRANPFSGPVVEQINHLAANVHSWDELRGGNLLSSV